MAMNERLPRTQGLLKSLQQKMQTLIERKDAYNLQVLQDWKTFISLVKRCWVVQQQNLPG